MLLRLRHLVGDLLFPPRCVSCGHLGTLWCEPCQGRVARFADPRCPRCDLPAAGATRPCRDCVREPSALDAWRVVGPHAEPLRGAIHALKYERRTALAAPLAALLGERWQTAGIPVAGILPIPLHPNRLRERGFNQSELLATHAAARLRLPVRADLLQRERDTPHQVGLGRADRLVNVEGAFSAAPEVAGQAWLLLDDVCTSGATLEASAQALLDAGAGAVYALTLARVPRHTGERATVGPPRRRPPVDGSGGWR